MNSKILIAMSSAALLAAAAMSTIGCEVTTGEGVGGGSEGGSTGDGGTTPTAGVGGAGSGGGDSCIGCGTYVFDDAASVEDVCGFISETDGVLDCDADSSCALLKAVGDCTCSETGCATECADSCAGTGAADEACTDCSLEKCGAETNACIGDQ